MPAAPADGRRTMMSPRKMRRSAWALALSLPVVTAGPCYAQALIDDVPNLGADFIRDQSVSVLERKQPGYELPSFRLSGFDFDPSLGLGYSFDDNIYASAQSQKSDSFATLRTQEIVQSDWSRNSLMIDAHAAYSSYAVNEDNLTGGVLLRGRFDVNSDNALVATESADHGVEARSASGAPTFTKHPVEFDREYGKLTGASALNRIKIEASLSYESLDYANAITPTGVVVDQHYRDRDLLTEQIQGSYALTPASAIFVRIAGNQRDFPINTNSGTTYLRSSNGIEITSGVNLDFRDLLRGEASLGYLQQSFRDPRVATVSGPGASGQIDWFPTGLTTVTIRFQRVLGDSALAQSPILVSSSGGVEVDHELLRSLILTGRVDYEVDSYQGLSRTDTRPSCAFSITYKMNRYFNLLMTYNYLEQMSSGFENGNGFTDDRVSLTAVARY